MSGDLLVLLDRGLCVLADNLAASALLPDGCADLVYLDPPFNTGRTREMRRMHVVADPDGDRTGFGGRRYRSRTGEASSYPDDYDDYLGFLEPRLREARRLLAPAGTLYVHLDPRESHYVKVALDGIFGRAAFLNEVVWAYDYGARSRRRWPAKHDVLLVYVRDPRTYHFDLAEVERIPYMAPSLVGADKAARGKTPTDVWWHTVVPTGSRERTGYPTQKPLGVLRRVVAASCPPDGLCVDLFAGSGTTGAAALSLGRRFVCVDANPQALAVMRARFAGREGVRMLDVLPVDGDAGQA